MAGLYENLMGALQTIPQQPQSLWQGIAQPLVPQQAPAGDPSPLAQMMIMQQRRNDPRAFMPTIDPGVTWGNHDRNNVRDYDVQVSRTSILPPENI